MEKKPKLVAISSPKGGVGKSAITAIVASVIHYTKSRNVVVVDSDDPQYSIYNLRERELEIAQKNSALKDSLFKQYERIQKPAYTILRSDTASAFSDLNNHLEQLTESVDLVLFDLPGTLNSSGVILTLSRMDYIFMPIIADNMVMQSSLEFVEVITEEIIHKPEYNLKGVYLFWNRIDGRERKVVYRRWSAVMAQLNMNVLSTYIPDTKRYNREAGESESVLFRSSLLPPESRYLSGSHISPLIEEMLAIIKLPD